MLEPKGPGLQGQWWGLRQKATPIFSIYLTRMKHFKSSRVFASCYTGALRHGAVQVTQLLLGGGCQGHLHWRSLSPPVTTQQTLQDPKRPCTGDSSGDSSRAVKGRWQDLRAIPCLWPFGYLGAPKPPFSQTSVGKAGLVLLHPGAWGDPLPFCGGLWGGPGGVVFPVAPWVPSFCRVLVGGFWALASSSFRSEVVV